MKFDGTWTIIPAYNAADTIADVIAGVRRNAPDCRIVVVDDGSTDETKQVLKKQNVKCLQHVRNLGKGAALKTGFGEALQNQARLILTLDADGQHDPDDIHLLLQKLEEEPDIIVGSRMSNTATMPIPRQASNRLTSRLIAWRIGQSIPDSQCGFRLIKAHVLQAVSLNGRHFDLESELLIKAGLQGFRIASVGIQTIYQSGQHSAMKPVRDTWRFVRLYLQSLFW